VSFDVISDLNWLAVVVAAIVYYAIGAVWFAPFVTGRMWQRSIGWDPSQPAPAMTAKTIALPLIAYFVAAIAVAMLAAATGSDDLSAGIVLGLVVAVGFAGSILGVTAAFETTKPQPWTWFAISFGYHLIGLVVTAVIVSVWV
jgi:hypothetical protein